MINQTIPSADAIVKALKPINAGCATFAWWALTEKETMTSYSSPPRTLFTMALTFGLALCVLAPAMAQDAAVRVAEISTSRAYTAAEGATDATTTFRRTDGRVFVVVRIENPTGAEQDIRVAFERAEETAVAGARGGVALHIPASPRYRTVARTSTNRAPGRWRAVVRNAEGAVIGQVEFEITE